MQTIKKYANRKLYHTNHKRYITLDGIAKLVQSGDQVEVIDNETGEDITANILAQVVLQPRGRNGGPLPTNVLTGLIRLGGGRFTSWRRAFFTSIIGQEVIDTEIQRRLEQLVSEGKLSPDEADRWQRLLLQHDPADAPTEELVLQEADVPTHNDVARLYEQVDTLTAAVEELMQQRERALPDKDT